MGIYNQTPIETLFSLVLSENPLLGSATSDQFVIDKATVVSGGTTSVRFRGKPGSGYTGVQTVQYSRVNVGTLFSGVTPTLTQYTATKLSDLLPGFNAKYGMNFTAADLLTDTVIAAGSNSQVLTLNASPSLMYYGAVSFTWTRGTKQLVDYYPNRTLTAITLPDAMLKAFKTDFSSNVAVLTAHDTSVAFTSGSTTAVATVNMLTSKLGLPFTLGATTTPGSGLYDLSGFTLTLNTIDQIPDANPDYRKVAILTPPVAYGNQYSPIYLHYDYRSVIETSSIITVPVLTGLTA